MWFYYRDENPWRSKSSHEWWDELVRLLHERNILIPSKFKEEILEEYFRFGIVQTPLEACDHLCETRLIKF